MITITIKGLSKEAHLALKKRAATHGRSLNTEAIAVLEASVRSTPVDAGAVIARARAVPQLAEVPGDPGGNEALQERPAACDRRGQQRAGELLAAGHRRPNWPRRPRRRTACGPRRCCGARSFGNVLAGYLRRKRMTEAEANAAFLNAQKDLGAQEFTVPAEPHPPAGAGARSARPYDCEYVALAQDLGVPLVTTNQQILREFPKTAVSLATICEDEMNKKLNITVMLGGPSAEREVSLRTGAAVARALRSLGHEVHELDPRTSDWILPAGTDVVFLALHGTYGEDGTVQTQLDRLGVPYTGCDAEASRVAFDKVLTKQRCLEAGVPTARFVAVTFTASAAFRKNFSPPLVVKPVAPGFQRGPAICRASRRLAGGAGGGPEI